MDASVKNFVEHFTTPLLEFLAEELPTGNDPNSIDKLKKMAAYSESSLSRLSVVYRKFVTMVAEKEREATKEYLTTEKKPSKTGRNDYLQLHLPEYYAWKKQLDDLQSMLHGRVVLAQSFMKNTSAQNQSSAIVNNVEKIKLS